MYGLQSLILEFCLFLKAGQVIFVLFVSFFFFVFTFFRLNYKKIGHPGRMISQSENKLNFEVPLEFQKTGHSEDIVTDIPLPEWQVWGKPQNNNTYAVLLLNFNSNYSKDVSIDFKDVPFQTSNVMIQDIWTGKILGTFSDSFTAENIESFGNSFILLSQA